MTSATQYSAQQNQLTDDEARVTGWWVFAGFMLGIAGTLDVIWGIAAISGSSFFVSGQHYIISNLNTWGWVNLIFGSLQLIAACSLFAGGGFGRWMGIITASLAAIVAMFSIPAYPFWSLAVFSLSVIVVYQLAKPAPA